LHVLVRGIDGYRFGNQFGMSYMSSAFARVIDSVLPGGAGRTRPPSKRGGGTTFSVTGNAQSGLSAAAATAGRSASASTPMTFFMTPPSWLLFKL
jgi:hypothetical protein